MRFLYDLGPAFEGSTPSAAWEGAELGLRSMRLFDGCAIVSEKGWDREFTELIAFLMPCPVRVFDDGERDQAISWLSALPEGATTSHRLIPEIGVLVVEIKEALLAQDFDALALTADEDLESAIKWAGSRGALNLPAQPERVQMSLANQNSSGAARGADGHSFWGTESSS